MNPFCKFSSDGHSYTCNLCGATNDVPSFYYSTVDGQGRRFDSLERPEKKEVMKSDGVVRLQGGRRLLCESATAAHLRVRGGRDEERARERRVRCGAEFDPCVRGRAEGEPESEGGRVRVRHGDAHDHDEGVCGVVL